jgi:2'-hydroxyisoflavone reductase
VSTFTRGRTDPDLFPDVEALHGDRDGNLAALGNHEWDAVIDTSGYVPRVVAEGAQVLAGHVGHYTFVSSISVYADHSIPGQDESAPVEPLTDPASEDVDNDYGPLKAACETAVDTSFAGRSCHVRAGLLVGPWDRSGRFTWWPTRVTRGDRVLAPVGPDLAVQYIDARDLARWMVDGAENGRVGVFNATSPPGTRTLGEVVDLSAEAAGATPAMVWADEQFLLEQGVRPWMELPLWVPTVGDFAGFASYDTSAAEAAGLTLRPVSETVLDTLAWAMEVGDEIAVPPSVGLEPSREADLIAAWRGTTRGILS